MIAIIKYILLNSFRNKLFLGLIAALILCLFLGVFLGSTNLVEEQKSAIVLFAGSARISLVLGIAIFVCLNISRFFENKEIDFFISKAISREKFILSLNFGYFLCSLILVAIVFFFLLVFLSADPLFLSIWSLSMLCEIMLIATFSLLCSLILENSLLAIFSSLGFYLLSRLMGFFTLSINTPWQEIGKHQSVSENILKILSLAFPRLDLFTQSKWLIYGIKNSAEIYLILVQTVIFLLVMLFMSFYDISKKEF